MGNLCGKESDPDHFAQPGRTLSSAPPSSNTKTSSVPKKVGGPPRTLGSNSSPANAGGSAQQEDARRKAAEAAEARANVANKPKGKLAAQLQEQKKQTRADTLEAASRDERRLRDADAAAEARVHN